MVVKHARHLRRANMRGSSMQVMDKSSLVFSCGRRHVPMPRQALSPLRTLIESLAEWETNNPARDLSIPSDVDKLLRGSRGYELERLIYVDARHGSDRIGCEYVALLYIINTILINKNMPLPASKGPRWRQKPVRRRRGAPALSCTKTDSQPLGGAWFN